MIIHTAFRKLVLALLGIALAGCATPAFDGRATNFNESMSDASDRQIVLNILRASARKPLYFSTISSVDSRQIGDLNLDFDVPIGPGASGFDLLPSIGINDPSPRFTVSPLMNASFMRSILRPVELGIFERMLSRSYNDELVMRLFIGEIGWESEPLTNDVDTFENSAFRRRLRLLLGLGLASEPLLGDNTLIEDLEQDDMLELIDSIEGIATPRLSIVPDRVTGKFDIIGEPGGFRLCFRRPPVLDVDALSEKQLARAVDLTCRIWVVSQLTRAGLGGRDLKRLTTEEKVRLLRAVDDQTERNADFIETIDSRERTEDDPAVLSDLVESLLSQSESGDDDGVGEQELGRLEHFGGLAIIIRSPVEMFDFLGEVHRDALRNESAVHEVLPDNAYRPYRACKDQTRSCDALTFFKLRNADPAETQAVVFDGRRYTVANLLDAPDDLTIETVGILSNLTSIFIESDDVEATARVTVLP